MKAHIEQMKRCQTLTTVMVKIETIIFVPASILSDPHCLSKVVRVRWVLSAALYFYPILMVAKGWITFSIEGGKGGQGQRGTTPLASQSSK